MTSGYCATPTLRLCNACQAASAGLFAGLRLPPGQLTTLTYRLRNWLGGQGARPFAGRNFAADPAIQVERLALFDRLRRAAAMPHRSRPSPAAASP